jgi:Glycogen recognition site of AMP-activated protein kinase
VFEPQGDPLDRLIERLREPMEMDPTLDDRVMQRLAGAGGPRDFLGRSWDWLRRPRTLSLSPLTGLLAAALGAVALWLGAPHRSAPPVPAGPANSPVQFVVVVPGAKTVDLVGDFNDWDRSATPMQPTRGAIWSVTVPLAPGRHRYAFLVDGSRWLADPDAPRAPDDFDTPSSVVTVGG